MQEEVQSRTVTLAISTTKLTARTLRAAIRKLRAAWKKGRDKAKNPKIPHGKQTVNKWSPEQRERYFNTLAKCDDVITLNTHYTPQCMLERNRYMVDHADYLLAVYDCGGKGGTAYTIRYARENKREIIVIHPDTLEIISAVDWEALERRKQLRILPGKQENT